jgi:hypothetical protein
MRGNYALLVGLVASCTVASDCGLHIDGLTPAVSPDDDAAAGSGGSAGTGGEPSTGGSGGSAATGGAGGGGTGGTGMGAVGGGSGAGGSGAGGTGGMGGVGGSGAGGMGGVGGSGAGGTGDGGTGGGTGEIDGSATGGSGGMATGGQGGTADAGTPDAAMPPTSGTIECGGLSCDADNQVCCAGPAGTTSCVRRDLGCGTASTRACDGPEDCDGERICCAEAALVGGYRSSCIKPSECVNAGGAPICRRAADCFTPYKSCGVADFSGSVVQTCQK